MSNRLPAQFSSEEQWEEMIERTFVEYKSSFELSKKTVREMKEQRDKARELARWMAKRLLAVATDMEIDGIKERCEEQIRYNPEIFKL